MKLIKVSQQVEILLQTAYLPNDSLCLDAVHKPLLLGPNSFCLLGATMPLCHVGVHGREFSIGWWHLIWPAASLWSHALFSTEEHHIVLIPSSHQWHLLGISGNEVRSQLQHMKRLLLFVLQGSLDLHSIDVFVPSLHHSLLRDKHTLL